MNERGSVLVTGGCGFVGANLVRRLSVDGWNVRVLDNLSVGRKEYLDGVKNVSFSLGDIRSKEDLSTALDGCSAVVHLAAQTSVVDSVKDPWRDFEINVGGFLNLLIACQEKNIEKVVFASTNAVLGDQEMPINEQKLPCPISPYGAAKLACEGYANTFGSIYGVKTAILRFANVYGPYSHHKESVIHKFIKRAIKGEPLHIYGDGHQTRDFIHVDDISEAITMSLESNFEGVLQIATGKETSILEIVELIRDISGGNVTIEFKPPQKGEIMRNYSDISKAKSLGYNPKIAIHRGIEEVYKWYKSHFLNKV
jgi:UDP-glucose 4-epimerase